ncbi:MAG: AraC family transcriptional regulator [Verrucomicrobiota bacterium]
MSRKKAVKVNLRSPGQERTAQYFSRFLKGTDYLKRLAGNSHIYFSHGISSLPKPYPLTFHKELELVYVRQGRGAYYLAGKLYHFQKRLLLIAKPNEIHAMMSVPLKEKNESACLVFPLNWLGLELNVKSWPHAAVLNEAEAARLDLICGQISEEVKTRESGYEDMVRAKFQEICCLVRRTVTQPKKKRANRLVGQLREYIDRHFAEKINVLDITKNFGYTKQYLDRAFKKTMGVSLKRYILQRRVLEARILLETRPTLKVTAIAEQVGFEDYRLFHRIFKILVGVNSKAYRSVTQKTFLNKNNAD